MDGELCKRAHLSKVASKMIQGIMQEGSGVVRAKEEVG